LHKGNFWVGGTDDLIEGEWIWTDTDTGFDYTDWVHGQPDNSQTNEDCLVLWEAAHWHWNDFTCKSDAYYICERL
jgi:hypothetical protein